MAAVAGNLHLASGIMAIRAAVLAAWFSRATAGWMGTFVLRFHLFSKVVNVHLAPQSDRDCLSFRCKQRRRRKQPTVTKIELGHQLGFPRCGSAWL